MFLITVFHLTFFTVVSRIGDKYYCKHCNKTVSKTTFYEHRALYGAYLCELSSDKEDVESDMENYEHEQVIPDLEHEDRLFFSEAETTDDESVAPEELPYMKDNGNSEVSVNLQYPIAFSYYFLACIAGIKGSGGLGGREKGGGLGREVKGYLL